MGKIYVGDIGTQILVRSNEDLTNFTVLKFNFLKPDGTEMIKIESDGVTLVTPPGTDGQIDYFTIADDLDQVGMWKHQAEVTFSNGHIFKTETREFYVNAKYT